MQRAMLVGLLMCMAALPAWAQDEEIETQRLGQTGMKFLSLSIGARQSALGDAATALEGSSLSMFYNPASMAYQSGRVSGALQHVDWISDTAYNVGSVSFQPASGRYGVFGLSVEAVDYGDVFSTIRSDSDPRGFLDVGTVSPTALAAGVGYARLLTDRFAAGGHVKYVQQSLGSSFLTEGGAVHDHVKSTVAFDFGVLYKTGFRSLNFAASVRNFSRELTYAEDSFELPMALHIGLSMDIVDLTSLNSDVHSVLLAVDAERPRDYAEMVKLGVEYQFMNTLALRAGYANPSDERGVSLGAGLRHSIGGVGASFDYAYTAFGIFGAIHRLGVGFSLD